VVPRLILFGAVLAGACAAGFVTATSPAATARCGLSGVQKLHGQVSMTYQEAANAVIPGTTNSITISLSRQANDVAVHLGRLKTKVPGYYLFNGRSSGGSFAVADQYASKETSGSLTANSVSQPALATLGGHLGPCRYQLAVYFTTRGTFGGNTDWSGYSPNVSDAFVTPQRKVPPSGRLAGSTVVPAASDCDITYGTAGCAAFSGGWTTDFTMFKRCGTTSAGKCQSDEDTDFGDATISWNISPG
jgi:hypothetical protein